MHEYNRNTSLSQYVTNWQRVTNSNPCPACGRPDWCVWTDEGHTLRCMRDDGKTPEGMVHRTVDRDGGHHYVRVDDHAAAAPIEREKVEPTAAVDYAVLAARCERQITREQLRQLAGELGVTSDALRSLHVGWATSAQLKRMRAGWGGSRPHNAYTVPTYDAAGNVVGLDLRAKDGRKSAPSSLTGARRGLVIPYGVDQDDGPLLLVEGPSDVAACLTLGIAAIGRSSAAAGADLLATYLKDRDDIIIVGEHDVKDDGSYPGRDGAQRVAQNLADQWGRRVLWSIPPRKDIRSFLLEHGQGSGEQMIEALRQNAVAAEPTAQTANANESKDKESQADKCVELAQDVELFHAGEDDPVAYATIDADDHRETWPIHSMRFRRWIGQAYYNAYGKAPNAQAVQDALNVLAGQAIYDGPERSVAVRLAEYEGCIYLDLCDSEWRAVEIGAEGWRVVSSHSLPVRFIRKRGQLPLPVPESGGSIDELRPLVNLPDYHQWRLFVAWLVAAFRPMGPYPILTVNGEQGSAKSTLCRFGRALIDPNQSPLRRPPSDERDLMIAAQNGWAVVFDNLSGIAPRLSDALCSLATGGGFSTRELYSDDDEKLFSAQRPVMLNGIDELATRPDLLDRALQLTLPTMTGEQRTDEANLHERYEDARPRVLEALANHDTTKLDRAPRMADFARWVVAAEPALPWPEGGFMDAYEGNREAANDVAIEASPVGPALMSLMNERHEWAGKAADLLAELEANNADEYQRKCRGWPKGPQAMGNALRRLAPNLRAVGIEYHPPAQTDKRRIHRLERRGP